MATVSLYQQRSTPGPGGYQVLNQITAASGIPRELFVYDTVTGLFNHVASVDDFRYPVGQAAAQLSGERFYRLESATVAYPDVATALDFAKLVKDRVDLLLKHFDSSALSFVGSETTPYPTPA